MTELATSIQEVLSRYPIGQVLAEGRISYDLKQTHGNDVCTPDQFNVALKELEQAQVIKRRPIFPDWQIMKQPA
jgi:hypothetical protein